MQSLTVEEVAAVWDEIDPICPFCPTGAFSTGVLKSCCMRRVVLPINGKNTALYRAESGATGGGHGRTTLASSLDDTISNANTEGSLFVPPPASNAVDPATNNRDEKRPMATTQPHRGSYSPPPPLMVNAHTGEVLSDSTFTDFPIFVSQIHKELGRGIPMAALPICDQQAVMMDHVLFSNNCAYSRQVHQERVAAQFGRSQQEEAHKRQLAQIGKQAVATAPDVANKNAGYLQNAAFAKMRSLVSQEKRRFQEEGFDLDLTYITRRIIAMGFPSSGRESYFRNPVDEVERFFRHRHGDGHFRIYNLCSERVYDLETRFNGQFRRYPFDDHNAPCPFSLIADCCNDASSFLMQHKDNVIAIHCKAGKGRTGLLVSCLLRVMEGNKLRSADEALKFFGEVRTADGKGVTIPSQARYVRYWDYVLGKLNGVPPPRLPAGGQQQGSGSGPTQPSNAVAPNSTVENQAMSGSPLAPANSKARKFFSIHLQGIALRSHVLNSFEQQPSSPPGTAGYTPAPEIFFTIQENNVEVFDSRKGALVTPSAGKEATTQQQQLRSTITNTKTTSMDFFVKNRVGPVVNGADEAGPFTGHIFSFLTESQALVLEGQLKDKWGPQGGVPQSLVPPSTATHASLRSSTAKMPSPHYLLLAGDVKFTFFRQSTSLLMKQTTTTEMFHFWVNTFLMDLMSVPPPSAGGASSTRSDPLPGPTSTQPLREVHFGKLELDGTHKDKKHATYCKDMEVVLFFTRDREYHGPEARPLDRTADKALRKQQKLESAGGGVAVQKAGSETDSTTDEEGEEGSPVQVQRGGGTTSTTEKSHHPATTAGSASAPQTTKPSKPAANPTSAGGGGGFFGKLFGK